MLECVFPAEIVAMIYHFKNAKNAKIVINNYVRIAKMRRAAFLSFIDFSVMSLYTITIADKPDELIQTTHRNLTILLNSQFSSTYSREMWRTLLNRVSKILMYYYNKLATNNCLKNSNINYKYFKACVELWFKLCQKNYFWLYLSYLKTIKPRKANCLVKSITFKTIKNFADFRFSPIIVPDGSPS